MAEAAEGGDAVAAVLVSAFVDDPVMSWMQPVRSRRAALLRRLFTAQLRHEYGPVGGLRLVRDAASELVAVALWKPPDTGPRAGPGAQLRTAAAMVAAVRTRLPSALAVRTALERARPVEPHWYLNKLGTRPDAQHQGWASALLADQLRRCDDTGTPVYLEATRHALTGFYERYGFRCTKPIDVPYGGPRLWGMWRPPA